MALHQDPRPPGWRPWPVREEGRLAYWLESRQSACSLMESPNYSLLGTHMVAWPVAAQRAQRGPAAHSGVQGDSERTSAFCPGVFLSPVSASGLPWLAILGRRRDGGVSEGCTPCSVWAEITAPLPQLWVQSGGRRRVLFLQMRKLGCRER